MYGNLQRSNVAGRTEEVLNSHGVANSVGVRRQRVRPVSGSLPYAAYSPGGSLATEYASGFFFAGRSGRIQATNSFGTSASGALE